VSDAPTAPTVELLTAGSNLAETAKVAAAEARGGKIALIRDIDLDKVALRRFCRSIGRPLEPVALPPGLELQEVTEVTNARGVSQATNWHFDQSFMDEAPDWSVLYCPIGPMAAAPARVPTVFCDCVSLLKYLSDDFVDILRRLEAEHRAYYPSEGVEAGDAIASARHPAILKLSDGVEALFLAPATASGFVGLSERESRALLALLYPMLNWPEVCVRHDWQYGDLLVWQNCRYCHRALPHNFGDARPLWRVIGYWN
jgi:alpha-ketoglutarate-dependent taurine dioxygenase